MAFKMRLDSRSYGGKKFRPAPITHLDSDSGLFLCVTPWGQQEVAEVVVESIKSFCAIANEDTEVTVPYEKKPNLDRFGNVLRMAVIMASEKINKDFNKKSYSAGFEIFAGIHQKNQWTYVCCGQPSLVFMRLEVGALPVHSSLDLNVKLSAKILTDPLPNHLLGLGQRPPILFSSQSLSKGDRFALVSRSYIPNDFFAMPFHKRTLDSLSQVMAQDNTDIPFWLGLLSF